MSKIIATTAFHRRNMGEDSWRWFKRVFKKIGYHMGDPFRECFGKDFGDEWIIYIAKRKLTKRELLQEIRELREYADYEE